MSQNTIDRALITQFSDMLHVASQQIRARLRPFVRVKPMVGDRFAYDGLGTVEAREVNSRITPTTFDDIEHLRRKINRRRFVVTLPIDASDVRGMLTNPQGEYAQASIKAMERVFDRVGVEAANATVATGREFETDVPFGDDGGNTVTATGGMTVEDLSSIRKFWINNEVGNDVPESMVLLITGNEEEDIIMDGAAGSKAFDNPFTSRDYTNANVADVGRLGSAYGLSLVVYGADVPNPILNVASTTRNCLAFTARGLCYGLSKEMGVSIQPRPDYIETTQVQIVGELGAVRTEGKLVQQVDTTAAGA